LLTKNFFLLLSCIILLSMIFSLKLKSKNCKTKKKELTTHVQSNGTKPWRTLTYQEVRFWIGPLAKLGHLKSTAENFLVYIVTISLAGVPIRSLSSRDQFHQRSIKRFYARRSRKRKKTVKSRRTKVKFSVFCVCGIYDKWLMKLTTGALKLSGTKHSCCT